MQNFQYIIGYKYLQKDINFKIKKKQGEIPVFFYLSCIISNPASLIFVCVFVIYNNLGMQYSSRSDAFADFLILN